GVIPEEDSVESTEETNEPGKIKNHGLQEIQKEINNYIRDNDLTNMIETKLSDEGLLVTILTDVTFDSGSAQVNSKGEEIAKEVSNFLDTNPPHEIIISGHADDRPIHNSEFKSNWELSVIRSEIGRASCREREYISMM